MEPIRCKTCDELFTPRQARTIYCSRACYWESLKGARKSGIEHRTQTAKGHPIAPPGGVTSTARMNLYEKIGPGPHPCHWCGVMVDWRPGNPYAPDALIADHLDWDSVDDRPDNLVPSCSPCNSHRRKAGDSKRLRDDEPTLIRGGRRTRAVRKDCEFCGGEFLALPADLKVGRGRFCSRSCARRNPRSR